MNGDTDDESQADFSMALLRLLTELRGTDRKRDACARVSGHRVSTSPGAQRMLEELLMYVPSSGSTLLDAPIVITHGTALVMVVYRRGADYVAWCPGGPARPLTAFDGNTAVRFFDGADSLRSK